MKLPIPPDFWWHTYEFPDGTRNNGFYDTAGLIIETHIGMVNIPYPAARFYPGAEFADDPTNWYGMNPPMITALLGLHGLTTTGTELLGGDRALFWANKHV